MTRYYNPDCLEMTDDGVVIYLHADNCPSFCEYACNGRRGDLAAADIEARWKRGDLTQAELDIANDTRKLLRSVLNEWLRRSEGAAPDANLPTPARPAEMTG